MDGEKGKNWNMVRCTMEHTSWPAMSSKGGKGVPPVCNCESHDKGGSAYLRHDVAVAATESQGSGAVGGASRGALVNAVWVVT